MKVDNCKINADGVKIQESKRWAQVYTARWIIDTDGVIGPLRVQQDARNPAVNGTPVPSKGAAFSVGGETDLSSFAQDFNWQRVAGKPTQWTCDVTWRPLDPAEGGSPGNIQIKNPLERPAIAWWEFEETSEVVEQAKNITALAHLGRATGTMGPIVNGAGKTFDALPERPKSTAILVMQRAFASLTSIRTFHDNYYQKLNSNTYRGAAAKTLLVRRITSSQPLFENNQEYFMVQTHLAYNKDTWKFTLVNQGLGYLDPNETDANRKYKTIGRNGQTITEPVLLTATGALLAENLAGNTIEYEYSDAVSFTNLDAGTP